MVGKSAVKPKRVAKVVLPSTTQSIREVLDKLPTSFATSVPKKEHEAQKLLRQLKASLWEITDATPKQYEAIARILASKTVTVPNPLDGAGKISHLAARKFIDTWLIYSLPSNRQIAAAHKICSIHKLKPPPYFEARLVNMLVEASMSGQREDVVVALGRYQIMLGRGGSGCNDLYYDQQVAAFGGVPYQG